MASKTRDKLKVALVQHENKGSVEANLSYIADQTAEAAQRGAELILLQELHNTAYFCQTEDVKHFDLAESVPGPSTDFLSKVAARNEVCIVASLFERRATGLYHNTVVVLDIDGRIAGSYRKMHIPDDPGYHEKFYFTPGDLGFSPIDTQLGRLGVLICWDQWFPEAARLMAMAGADILLYPTAIGWDPQDDNAEQERQLNAWQTIQKAHAIANGLPLAVCNRVGHEKMAGMESRFWGHSFIAGPQGEILASGNASEETLIGEIDLFRSENVRRIWPFLRDRRIDAYGGLSKRYLDEDTDKDQDKK